MIIQGNDKCPEAAQCSKITSENVSQNLISWRFRDYMGMDFFKEWKMDLMDNVGRSESR